MNDREGRKLTVAWLNVLAAGIIATGTASQIGPVLLGERTGAALGRTGLAILLSIALGLAVHGVARMLVRKME
jgi:hypothetical protein